MNDTVNKDMIADALFDALTGGGDKDLARLNKLVKEYAAKYPSTYRSVRRQPFACALIDAILEAEAYNSPEEII